MIATAIHTAAAAGLGAMAGLLGGLFGVGGGFLVIPLLGFFYGMDQQTAQGTVLIMVVPNVVWAFSRYRRRFGIDLRMAAAIAGSALIATYPTARQADRPSHRDPLRRRRELRSRSCGRKMPGNTEESRVQDRDPPGEDGISTRYRPPLARSNLTLWRAVVALVCRYPRSVLFSQTGY